MTEVISFFRTKEHLEALPGIVGARAEHAVVAGSGDANQILDVLDVALQMQKRKIDENIHIV